MVRQTVDCLSTVIHISIALVVGRSQLVAKHLLNLDGASQKRLFTSNAIVCTSACASDGLEEAVTAVGAGWWLKRRVAVVRVEGAVGAPILVGFWSTRPLNSL